ncbi:MAG: hypothetical protein RL557_979 [archaeon]|jgi:hypothetical protein
MQELKQGLAGLVLASSMVFPATDIRAHQPEGEKVSNRSYEKTETLSQSSPAISQEKPTADYSTAYFIAGMATGTLASFLLIRASRYLRR